MSPCGAGHVSFSLDLDLSGVRIVRTDSLIECSDIDNAFFEAGADLVLVPDGVTESDLCHAVKDAQLLLMCYTPVTSKVINSAPRLKGIVKYGVGIDAIDIPAATVQGVPVVNVPDYAESTVAEGAFCVLLALLKRLLPINAAVQEYGWIDPTSSWLGDDVRDRTIGVIGAGRIGCAFARMAHFGFGARVIGYDPYVSKDTMALSGVEKVDDLHALLSDADVVSMHNVLNSETRTMIGPLEFAAMHRQPVFINVSRGALIDDNALVSALDSGQISAAGLDAYAHEPLDRIKHPLATLFDRDNVILLPHLTFFTRSAMRRLSEDTLARCREVLADEPVLIRSSDPRLVAQAEAEALHVRLQ